MSYHYFCPTWWDMRKNFFKKNLVKKYMIVIILFSKVKIMKNKLVLSGEKNIVLIEK